MIDISISDNIKQATAAVKTIHRHVIPSAVVGTLNALAFDSQAALKAQAPQKLDRPTPFTQKGFRVRKASKRRPTSVVYVAGSSGLPGQQADRAKYLWYQIVGGRRRARGKAIPVPTKKMKTNRYGNMPRGRLARMMADKEKYFHGSPGDGAPEGIYQRVNDELVLLVAWEQSVEYDRRFPFYKIVNGLVNNKVDRVLIRFIRKALRDRGLS